MPPDQNNEAKTPKRKVAKSLPGQLAAKNALVASIAADNTAQAWQMRKAGRTITEIAKELGVCESTARSYLHQGMVAAREQYVATAMDHIQDIIGQLEEIITKWKTLADCPAAEGADRAAAIVLKALDQKAKLLGLEGKGAGLVIDPSQGGEIDLTEALKSPATREALKRMIAQAEEEEEGGTS